MIAHERLTVFSLAAGIAYTLAYYFNWPLLRFYPAVQEIHFTEQSEASGFVILWYGWLMTAALIGVVVAWAMPRRWMARLPSDLGWLVPVALIAAVLVYEKRWFL